MDLTFALEIDEFESRAKAASKQLAEDLHQGGMKAAQAGVDAEKAYHPYQDHTPGDGLTDSAHVEEDHVDGGGVMLWPVPYADYVDQGTSRSRPYPFTPLAMQVAERDLEHETKLAEARFKEALERGR